MTLTIVKKRSSIIVVSYSRHNHFQEKNPYSRVLTVVALVSVSRAGASARKRDRVAVEEAANIDFPMENFIGNWWAGAEHDVTPAGPAVNGYKSLSMNRIAELHVFDAIKSNVHDAGDAAGGGSNIGSVLYTRGMYVYAAMLAAEAIAKAQEIHGVTDITPAKMRDGMAALEITAARMEELGMADIGPGPWWFG